MSQAARPKKSLGQHFLTDRNIIDRIVDAGGLAPGDSVLEVGAGRGDLTAALAERGYAVTALEIDGALAEGLRRRFAAFDNVVVLHGDALQLDSAAIFGREGRFSVVANLPYNAGTAIVRHLLESEPRPMRLVVMLQKEVAQAMVAAPGDLSLVGIGVQVYATGRRLFDVAPGAFHPPPKVVSSVISLDTRPVPLVAAAERETFFEVVRAGFSAPRKQLRNSLANGLGLDPATSGAAISRAGLDPACRPQTLSVEQWRALARGIRE